MGLTSFHQNLSRKYGGNPALLIVAGLAGIGCILFFGSAVKTYYYKSKKARSEEYANFLYDQETRIEHEN